MELMGRPRPRRRRGLDDADDEPTLAHGPRDVRVAFVRNVLVFFAAVMALNAAVGKSLPEYGGMGLVGLAITFVKLASLVWGYITLMKHRSTYPYNMRASVLWTVIQATVLASYALNFKWTCLWEGCILAFPAFAAGAMLTVLQDQADFLFLPTWCAGILVQIITFFLMHNRVGLDFTGGGQNAIFSGGVLEIFTLIASILYVGYVLAHLGQSLHFLKKQDLWTCIANILVGPCVCVGLERDYHNLQDVEDEADELAFDFGESPL